MQRPGSRAEKKQYERGSEVGRYSGEIEESGATQRYRVELKAGQSYRIEVMGSDTGQGTLPDPGLQGGVSFAAAAGYFSHLDGFGEMEDFFESFLLAADAGIDGA